MTSLLVFATLCLFLATGATGFDQTNIVAPFRRQQNSGTFVAFSVGLTHDENLNSSSIVKYDKVWTNQGNGYNISTGIFTCTRAGVYVFIYHGLSQKAGQMWLDLMKNNKYEISGYAHNTADWAAASNSLVLSLAVDDTVYIQGHGTSELYGRKDELYATFSGFIL